MMFAAGAMLGGLLLGGVLAELALRAFGYGAAGPVVRYTIQRASSRFSARLDPASPLFYTHAGIRVEEDRLSIAYPGRPRRVVPLARTPGVLRIAALGDSLTEHWDFPGYVNYTDFLEQRLVDRRGEGRAEVIPLGVGGYTTWQQRHFFERFLSGLEADVLLLQYCPNDGDVMGLRPRPPLTPAPANEWPSHEIVGERFGRPDYSMAALGPVHSRLLWLLRFGLASRPALHGYRQVAGNDEQERALVWLRDLAAARGTPLLVAVFPLLDGAYPQSESAYIRKLLARLEIDHVDIRPALEARGTLASFARDLYHPTTEGYRIAAGAIFDHLVASGLVPAR